MRGERYSKGVLLLEAGWVTLQDQVTTMIAVDIQETRSGILEMAHVAPFGYLRP